MTANPHDILNRASFLLSRMEDVPEEDWEAVLGEAVSAYLDDADAAFAGLGTAMVRLDQRIRENRAFVAALNDERDRLTRQRQAVREQLEALLKSQAELTGDTKAQTPVGTAFLTTRDSYAFPADAADWPAELVSEVPQPPKVVLDKAGAKARLKAGEAIPGMSVTPTTSLSWRGVK